jgi:phosphatidylinositol alpha-1,6-mannosyltransferase
MRDLTLSAADVFVMPNVPVPGDMEGFDLAAIEAALHGAVVGASRLEGLEAAVIDGRTRFLYAPLSAEEFASRIMYLFQNRQHLAELGKRFRSEAVVHNSALDLTGEGWAPCI